MAKKKRTKAERSAAARKAWAKRRLGKQFAVAPSVALPVSALLSERGRTHGDFETNATISQMLKDAMRTSSMEYRHPVQREALDMIALKLSRILSGDGTLKDHWDDIAGYATLVSKHLGE